MRKTKTLIPILILLLISLILTGCSPTGPCEFTQHIAMQVYRLPDVSSEFQGTIAGETHTILAYTDNGWIGFDPGIAQAGNIGLAHHRWVYLNGIVTPSCLAGVDQVTLADVQAVVDNGSGHERSKFQMMFENFDQKANKLFNTLSTILKSIKYMGEDDNRNFIGEQPADEQPAQRLPNQELISQLTDLLPDGAETFIQKTAVEIVDQLLADQSTDFVYLTRSAIQDEYKDLTVEQTESMLAVILLTATESLNTHRGDEIYYQPDSDKGSDDVGAQIQLDMLELEDARNDRRAKFMQTLSDLQKKLSNTADEIISNLK